MYKQMYVIENSRAICFILRLRFGTTHMVALKYKRTHTSQTDVNESNRKQMEVKESKWK